MTGVGSADDLTRERHLYLSRRPKKAGIVVLVNGNGAWNTAVQARDTLPTFVQSRMMYVPTSLAKGPLLNDDLE